MKGAITLVFLSCCTFFFSQNIVFSREFASEKNHIPLKILNGDPSYFAVLRYNKRTHDFIVEKRKKSNFEIVTFTPLNLDSVNANWFDYENLDYLFFEYHRQYFFVFEKVLNSKRSIFIKTIDSLGKSSGFNELATLEKDEATSNFRFIFSRSQDSDLLIVGEHYYQNNTSKKVILIYNLQNHSNKWISKLPLENLTTGFSSDFKYKNDNLYYLMCSSSLARYRTAYSVNQVSVIPIYYSKIQNLTRFNLQEKKISKTNLCLNNFIELKNTSLTFYENKINITIQYIDEAEDNQKKYCLFTQTFDQNLSQSLFCTKSLMDLQTEKRLTYYDSNELKDAFDKDFFNYHEFVEDQYLCLFKERHTQNYFKEILCLKLNLQTGNLFYQKIIPRKIFLFKGRTKFQNINEAAFLSRLKSNYVLVLENKANLLLNAGNYVYRKFKKLKSLSAGNFVLYEIKNDGSIEKSLIYKNADFKVVPLKYESNQNDFIFYLNKRKKEQFAILKL
jgi:hypothetical protein